MVLFLTGREEEVVLGGIQSLEPGSGDGSFDSVGKKLLCMFLLFLLDNGPPPPSCDKDTSKVLSVGICVLVATLDASYDS